MKDIYTTLDELTPLPEDQYLITRHNVVIINRTTLAKVLTNNKEIGHMLECLLSVDLDPYMTKDCQW